MSNIINLIYTRLFSKYSTILLTVFIIGVFSYIGYNAYNKYYKQTQSVKEFSNVANANTRKREANVLFFFADWCPHCKKAKPEWEKFTEEYNGKVVNDYEINCKAIDCTETKPHAETAALIAEYNIESYPTIIMLVNDNKIDYEAKVSKSGLEQLVLSGTANPPE